MVYKSTIGLIALLFCLEGGMTAAERSDTATNLSPAELFEQRIMPIFKSPEPASCIQCHLASVDLKDYIRPSHEQTFASLRDQGLIDLAAPEKSKILSLIRMGDKDPDKGAMLIHEKTRQAEYEAFAAWIAACCNDPKLRDLKKLPDQELARPSQPDEVIRHTRMNRVVDSFVRNVWSQRMRCFPCHTPSELDESNPKLQQAIERHKKFMENFGDEFGDRMDIFRETPEATVRSLVEKSMATTGGILPLINLAEPTKSLLVLKPTAKLPQKNENGEFEQPSFNEPVSHMGGLKMHVDDQSYKSFIAWIQDYARVVGNEYKSVDDLPLDNWHASKNAVIIKEVPEAWSVGSRIQLFVYARTANDLGWSVEPVAFTQGSVTPIKNVAGTLFLFGLNSDAEAKPLDPENAKLAPDKYLLRAYHDSKNRLAGDPTMLLPIDDFVGQAEITARWEEGFPNAEKILGNQFK
ncbi:MAG: hypothetical protein SGI77_25175 [Pirellulaceae bacterium]|nr:hypothetical protein [Pirellulaceae bacterium]